MVDEAPADERGRAAAPSTASGRRRPVVPVSAAAGWPAHRPAPGLPSTAVTFELREAPGGGIDAVVRLPAPTLPSAPASVPAPARCARGPAEPDGDGERPGTGTGGSGDRSSPAWCVLLVGWPPRARPMTRTPPPPRRWRPRPPPPPGGAGVGLAGCGTRRPPSRPASPTSSSTSPARPGSTGASCRRATPPTCRRRSWFDLHGLTHDERARVRLTGPGGPADEGVLAVVTPQGPGDVPLLELISAGSPTDDVAAFPSATCRTGRADLCIDTSRVYATGIPTAALPSALAIPAAGRVRRGRPCLGGHLPRAADGSPVSYQAVYGTADNVLPRRWPGRRHPGLLSANRLDESGGRHPTSSRTRSRRSCSPPVDDAPANRAERNGCAADPEEPVRRGRPPLLARL